MIKVEISGTCLDCNKSLNEYQMHVRCSGCTDNLYSLEDIETAIQSITTNDYHWKDKEDYEGFDSEDEKEIFMSGIKKGYSDALFHICDYFGTMNILDDFCKKYYEK